MDQLAYVLTLSHHIESERESYENDHDVICCIELAAKVSTPDNEQFWIIQKLTITDLLRTVQS